MDLHGWSQEPDGDYEAVFFVQEVKTLMLPPAAALWSFCRKNWIQNIWPNCYWALLKVTPWLAWPHGPLPQSSCFVSGNRISVDMWLVGCILGGWCWLRSHYFLWRWKLIRSIRCLWTWRPPVRKSRLAAKRPPCSPQDDLHQAPLWHPPFWPELPPVTCFPGCRVNLEDCFKLNISMRCPYPSPLAPWCSRMARQQQAAEWRLAPAWSPPEEGRGCTWLGNSHQKPGGLSCRSQLHPQVLRSRVEPRQTPGVPADEAQTRREAGAENRPRSCPEWTHLMPVCAATGWDYRVLDCWPCLIFHLSFLFYLGL